MKRWMAGLFTMASLGAALVPQLASAHEGDFGDRRMEARVDSDRVARDGWRQQGEYGRYVDGWGDAHRQAWGRTRRTRRQGSRFGRLHGASEGWYR